MWDFPAEMKVRFSPSGAHLFNRNTGINILLDEIQPPSSLWATAPRQISIALTNICDLFCDHCFAPKNSISIDPDRLINWIIELDANGCLGIGFGGGEPTLYRQFVEICDFVITQTSLAVTFTTHGHRLTENLLASLKGKVHFVRVSMDGVGTTYEMIRGRPFDALLDHLHNLRSITRFGINFVVNKTTVSDLDAAIMCAESVGASEFLLLPEQPVKGHGGIDNDTLQTLRLWIAGFQGAIPLTISELGENVFPLCNPLPNETGVQAYAHIDATGVLKRTSFDPHGVEIGPDGVIKALNRL